MDTPAYQQPAAVQIIRDRRGIIVGRFETQHHTKKTVARDARGLLVGQYDHRADVTRDARGVLVGSGNLLPALLPPMMIEIDELDFGRYSPAQLAAVRPNLERLADITRRNLRLLDGVLGVEGDDPALRRKHELVRAELAEARTQIETMRHDLATARAWIDQLQGRLAAIEDDEEDKLYRSVGLAATAHTVVAAARRALLQHHHPDRQPSEKKAAATASFQAVSAAFQRIKELRG